MKIKQNIHKLQEIVFNYVIIITYILYFLIFVGLSSSAPEYLNDLQNYTKIYVSLFLIFRFNPFREIEFTKLDAKIAFSAGLFLLTTTALQNIFIKFFKKVNPDLVLNLENNEEKLIEN